MNVGDLLQNKRSELNVFINLSKITCTTVTRVVDGEVACAAVPRKTGRSQINRQTLVTYKLTCNHLCANSVAAKIGDTFYFFPSEIRL